MTDQVTPEGGALPSDANASPKPETKVEVKGSEAGSSPAATESEKPKEPSGLELRNKELTRRLRQAERDRDRLLKLAEERPQPAPQQAQQPAQTKKTLKDFNYDDTAYTEHLRQETRAEAAEAARQEALRLRETEVESLRREKFEERVAAFSTAHPDYSEVVEGAWLCSKPMAEAIEDSDEGPALAYYLAQNPEVARQMSRLSPVQVGRELTRLETRLVSERQKAAEKPVTKAPPPPPKIEGSDPGNVERDPTKMTQKQFNKWREGYSGKSW